MSGSYERLFGRWGVVEHLAISAEYDGGKALEQAVIGGMSEEDEESDEGEEEAEGDDQENGVEGDAAEDDPSPSSWATWSNPYSVQAVPKETCSPAFCPRGGSLPPTDPRDTPYGLSGLRTAHVTFWTRCRCPDACRSAAELSRSDLASPSEPTGIEFYLAQHAALRPSLGDVRAYADSSMARFDHLQSMLLSSRASRPARVPSWMKTDSRSLSVEDGTAVQVVAAMAWANSGSVVAKRGFEKALAGKKQAKGASQLPGLLPVPEDRQEEAGYVGDSHSGSIYVLIKCVELAELRAKFEEDRQKSRR